MLKSPVLKSQSKLKTWLNFDFLDDVCLPPQIKCTIQMGWDKSFVLNREKEVMNCFPEAWQPLSFASCEVTEPIQTSSTCILSFWAIPSFPTCPWEALSLCWSSRIWERKMWHPTLCGGPWVAFERQKVLTGRNKFMSSQRKKKRFYTATVYSEKSGWREIKQLKYI